MPTTYSVTEAQRQLPKLVRNMNEDDAAVTITVRGEPSAYLIPRRRMEAILETLEIMGNPEAMKAIRDYEEGRTTFTDIDDL